MTNTYISIDLETTGLSPKCDKIIEIGAVKVENGQVTGTFSTFINPGRRLGENIIALTGIRDEDLVEAPYIEDRLPTLMSFMEELPVLGHSVLFDYSFLKKAAANKGISFQKSGLDTLLIARKYLADLEHRSLDYLCQHFQIPHHAHRALEDATATHALYQKLAELFYEREMEENPQKGNLFIPMELKFSVKKDFPATIQQKKMLYRLIRLHKIDVSVDIERLTKSEASRLENQIKSGKFGQPAPASDVR